ncbi:MAG: hypothetical protein PWQ67_1925 [Clostridia bacterium]|jgi:hypothetical protein|nr:hypothetical protein [Clostridia bacterium]MDN5323471.1 hypothetical protein [Clostridia bacterium]
MWCPNCGTYLNEIPELNYYKCSYCKGEWWPPERDDTPERLAEAAREAYFEDIRVGYFGDGSKRGGGSKVKGRKKKLKIKPFSQRYKLLRLIL